MAKEINEETTLKLSIKSLGGIAVLIFTLVSMWFVLQADIAEAKELPNPLPPDVTRMEYDMKDQLIRQTIVDFQKELAAQPMVDVDKEIMDQERTEKFFGRLAKKYSACPSRASDGDLGWVNMPVETTDSGIKTVEKSDFMEFLPQYEKSLTKALIIGIMSCEKHKIPEPIETSSGFHVVLICETRFHKAEVEEKQGRDLMDDVHKNAFHAKPKVWEEKFGPN